jgi:hypothetical protein
MNAASIEKAYNRRQITRESAIEQFNRIGMNGERELREIDLANAEEAHERRAEERRMERMFR